MKPLPFLKEITFRYYSCALDCSFFFSTILVHFPQICFRDILHNMTRYARFLSKHSLASPCCKNTILYLPTYVIFDIFHRFCERNWIMCFCDMLLVRKCLKIQIKVGSDTDCLLHRHSTGSSL